IEFFGFYLAQIAEGVLRRGAIGNALCQLGLHLAVDYEIQKLIDGIDILAAFDNGPIVRSKLAAGVLDLDGRTFPLGDDATRPDRAADVDLTLGDKLQSFAVVGVPLRHQGTNAIHGLPGALDVERVHLVDANAVGSQGDLELRRDAAAKRERATALEGLPIPDVGP